MILQELLKIVVFSLPKSH